MKDRTALALLSPEIGAGGLSGKTIIESSSGNTAKALGMIAHNFDLKVESVTSRSKVPEVSQLLQILGIKLIHVPGMSECPDPRDPYNPLKFIESRISQDPDAYFWTNQYLNPKNPAIHSNTTAVEIEDDIGIPDYFFSGIGTSGSSGGIATYFHTRDPGCSMI
ncbi:MAG: pyridoxal-phosphate dependent enzyme [Patescibacteria group bacterium]